MEITNEILEVYKKIKDVEEKINNIQIPDKKLLDDYSYILFNLKMELQNLERVAFLYREPDYIGDEIDLYIQNIHNTFEKDPDELSYIITVHGAKDKIGIIDVRFRLLKSEKYLGNIGAEINEEYRGKRYVKKAFTLLKDTLLEKGLTKPIFTVNLNNISSIKSLDAIGAKRISLVEDGTEPYYIYEYDLDEKESNHK